jgi:hypothetical protein
MKKLDPLRHETASNLRLQNASQLETIFMISLDKSSALKSWMNSKRSQKHFYGPKLKISWKLGVHISVGKQQTENTTK